MFSIPNPLHPAIVHFPIVLILLGTIVAVVAVFIRRGALRWLAAGLLAVGALGAVAATWSGDSDEEVAGELSTRADQVLEEHEEWGERTRNLALMAACFAIAGAASASRTPKLALSLGAAAALAAVASSYALAETGHYGGQLVYKHAVGVNTAAGEAVKPPAVYRERSKSAGRDD